MKIDGNVYNFGKFSFVQKVQFRVIIGDLKVYEDCVEWVVIFTNKYTVNGLRLQANVAQCCAYPD